MAHMAAGRRFLRSTLSLLVYVFLCLYKVSFTSYSQLSADLDCRITFHGYLHSPKRNISFSTWTFQPRGRRYHTTCPSCPSCISNLRTLPFADISNLDSSDGSFTSHGDDSCTEPASQQTLASEDYLENLSKILNYSSKDLRVAHLNICSLQYKIDELRLLQRICGFDILGISETHLDSSVPDNFLQIDGLQLIRRDRTKCKGGGVILSKMV